MAALDTLYFDLKINDLTGEQMKAIKSRLSNELKMNLDIGKDIQRAIGNTNTNIKIGADISAVELAVKRIMELVSKGDLSKNQISELTAITNAIKVLRQEAQKANKELKNTKVGDSPSSYVSNIKIDNRDGNIINSIKDKLEIAWQKAIALENELKGIYNSGKNIGGNDPLTEYVKKLTEQLNVARDSILGYETALSKMQNMQGSVSINNTPKSDFEIKKDEANIEARKRAWQNWASEQDKIEKQQAENAKRDAIRAAEKEKEDERLLKKVYAQNAAMMKLEATIESMELAMRRYQAVSNSLGKPESIEAAIKKMREYIERAKEASKSGEQSVNFLRSDYLSRGSSNIEKAITTETQLERQRQKAQAASEAQDKLAASHYRASIAADSHARASIRLGSSLTGLVSITGDLRNQIGMLVSVYTVEHLLKNVVEIGGEFEKQKLAMGSMLGSLEQADDIFNRMKNLALTSPFNFKDLSNYSRQLTAFGTPYKDLYDTTDRLADISAGLGGDMSRLVLAFSQVKAAAYLRGQEMRQFTEFGVSLPDLLAKKYSEAEHRIVTAGDVIERVSKRMVSFNDVKDVLWKSTDKGGQFYGMQNVLAQSTSGMASNLKDAIDTMYYDIANSTSGVIKGTIKGITELVSHWRELSSALGAATILWGAHRIEMAANNRLLGMGTAETLKGVMASKQEEASVLRRKALYGELSVEEKTLLANSKVLTFEDVKRLATSKAINSEALIRLVNTKKITAEQALQVASDLALTESEIKYLTTIKEVDMQLAMSSTARQKFALQMKKGMLMLGSNISMIANSIKATLATLFSPVNILMAGAFIGADAYMEYKQQMEHLDEVNKQTIKNAEDGTKTLNDFLSTHPIEMVLKGGDKNEIDKLIDEYKEQITSTPLDMSGFITNIDTITDATQKLKALREEMQALRDADESISKNGNAFAQSQKSGESLTPDWFNSINKGIINLANYGLNNFSPIPRSWTQDLRNYALQWQENGKSIEGVLSDVASSTDDLNGEMSKLNKNDIDVALGKLRTQFPQLASEIDNMRRAGSTNNEVIKAMLTMARDNKITLFDGIDMNTFDNYANNVKVMSDRMAYYVEDGIKRINNSMSNADVEGHTEKWKLAIVKSAQEQAKAWNLSGYSLEQWTFMVEDAVSKNSARIQDHPKVWQDMYNGIKQILWKNGYDINNATKEQVNQAFQTYKNETSKTKPWLANFLAMMNAYTRKNPIYIWNEMRFIGQEGGAVLSGRGKDLSSNLILNSKYKADLANIKTDKDAADYIKSKYDTYQQDLKDAKSNRKKVNDLNNKWNEFYNDWNSEMDVNFIIGGQKTPKPKKTGGGSKEDTFLKDMRARLDSVKKAMDEYKKWIQAGKSESESIGDVESMGIFSKGTFAKMSTESELNAWYKRTIKNLEGMMRKNKPSTERKKFLNEILSNLTDFDRDEFKRKLDEYSKQVETLISDTKTKWDNYQKLLSAGSSREDAANFSFGGKSKYSSLSEAMVGNFYDQMAKKNIRKNIDFGMKEEDVKKLLGDGKIAEELLKLWKEAKSQIEKDRIDIQINADKAKEQISSISDKIKSSIEKALDQSLGINISSGKQTRLSEVSSIDKNTGLLKLDENAKDILSPSQIENAKNLIESENQEITKLGSQLLELLPAWDDIFGKSAYKSLETLLRGMREMREIIANAKVVNDKNGKPSYFTSSYKDRDGNTQTVKGNIGELNRLRNQEDTSMGELNRKNPFVGMYKSLESYFSSKKDVKYWNEISSRADKNGGTTTYTDKNGNKQTITAKDAKTKANDAQDEASRSALSFSEAMQSAIGEMQKWNNALSLLGSTIEAVGGGTGVSDAAGLAGGMLSGASSLSALGPWGMAAGAAMGAITGIAELHDKKLDRAIEKSKQKVQELQNTYKAIEDSLKYNLGNAAVGTFINTDAVKAVKEADATIASIKSKGKLSIFDLTALSKANQTLKENWATVQYMKDGNVYNYQRNLYKQQLEQLEEQKQAEEDKKKTDQSKINDYNSQIQDMTTKITQFSEDLANSLYGIDIKGWASQFGDAIYEAWQRGESGADAFQKTANEILSNLVKTWFKTNVIEVAFKKLQTDLFGTDGVSGIMGSDNNLTQDEIAKIASDITSAQSDITKKQDILNSLYEGLKPYGIDIKDINSSSSTANAIKGVSEEVANIIAAYMDAIRQDTYNNRMNLQKIVDEGIMISESPIMQSQLQQLTQIQSNTYKNMELVGEIKSIFNDITLGNKKIYVK